MRSKHPIRLLMLFPETFLIIFGVAFVSGCASEGEKLSRVINEPAPLPADTRDAFGTLALLPTDAKGGVVFSRPETLAESFPWAARTANRVDAATRMNDPNDDQGLQDPRLYYDASRLLVASVAAGTAGLAEVLLSTAPKEELERCKTAIRQALEENPLVPGIENRLAQLASSKLTPKLVTIPASKLSEVSFTSTNRDFRALANANIDSVLVLQPWSQSFGGVQRLNPPIVFDAQVDLYVIRVKDGKIVYFNTLDYRSRERKFTEWGAKNAEAFRAELRQAQKRFAESIVEELFGE